MGALVTKAATAAKLVYMERKLAGLCTRCGAPASEDAILCATCRKERNRVSAECMQRRRAERRARKLCIYCARAVNDDYACSDCRVRVNRYVRRWVTRARDVSNAVNHGEERDRRIAARTVTHGDGRTRYHGQARRGQQTHQQLNRQDLAMADQAYEAFKAGVTLLGSEEAKTWPRGDRERVMLATANQGERHGRHVDDVLERLGHFKQRHGRRDGE